MIDYRAEQQLFLLLQSSVLGFGLGILFDFFNVVDKCHRRRRWLVFLCDVSFFVFAGFITFFTSLALTDGRLHPLLFFGIGGGFVAQHCLFGRYTSVWIYRSCRVICQRIRWLLTAFSSLVRYVWKRMCYSFGWIRAKIPKKPLKSRKKSTFFRKKS